VDGCWKAERGKPVTCCRPAGWLFFALRFLLGGIFLYSGILKVSASLPFADSIASFQVVPYGAISLVALGLPPLEILLGAMLVSRWRVREGSFGVFLLSVIFGLALSQALVRGIQVDCGCFGSGEPSTLKTCLAFGRDIFLIAASGWLYASSAAEQEHL